MSAMLGLSLQFLLIYLGKSWYYLFWIMPIMTHSRKYFNSQQQYCLKRVNLTEICHFGNQYYLQCFEIFCWIAFLRSTLNKREIFFLLAEEEKKNTTTSNILKEKIHRNTMIEIVKLIGKKWHLIYLKLTSTVFFHFSHNSFDALTETSQVFGSTSSWNIRTYCKTLLHT